MAEGVLCNIAEGILSHLASSAVEALVENIGLPSLKKEVQGLEDTVSTIKAVLLDAEEKQDKNHQLKDWVKKLKDAIYDADDLLDDFSTEAMRRQLMPGNKFTREVRLFFSNSNQLAYGLKMTRKLKAIKERLDKIASDRHKFQLEVRPNEKLVVTRRREVTHSNMPEIIIGRDKDKEAIIDLLLKSDVSYKLCVIPIIGIGGLGKTALAKYIFNDEKIIEHFHMRMWTCVSDEFDVQTIVKKILESIADSKVEDLQMNILASNLKKELSGKKYLLVLDDLWNEDPEKWLDLVEILNVGGQGCKILITARTEKVVKATRASSIYHLRSLNKEESWSLFKSMAFETDQEPDNKNLTNIGKDIVEKCCGVPLVIRTIGSLLYHEDTESVWLKFKDNRLTEISQQGENKILATLSLSYMYLPSHLKRCFAFCSLFPKDYLIDRQLLVTLWMANGFVMLSDEKQCPEEVGHEYFMDLYARGFFQELCGHRCKMHDLMHELATNVAGKDCASISVEEGNVDKKCRHISFDFVLSRTWKIPPKLAKAKEARTFLLTSQLKGDRLTVGPDERTCVVMCSKFRCLRVLDLHNLNIQRVPNSIGKLKHLRYLDLSYNKFEILPNSICNLVNLQTLDLLCCHNLRELPKDFGKLFNLRQLNIDDCDRLEYMPHGIGHLTSLQALPVFVVTSSKSRHAATLSELKGLNNLTGLLIVKNLGHDLEAKQDFEAANFKEKTSLCALSLEWLDEEIEGTRRIHDKGILESLPNLSNIEELDIRRYNDVEFPNWMMDNMISRLPCLGCLTINHCKSCTRLPPFEQLPHLKSLHLRDLPLLEYIDDRNVVNLTDNAFFPYLEYLFLHDLYNLKSWWREEGTINLMPSFSGLCVLGVTHCPLLRSIPAQSRLKRLMLENVTKELLQQQLTVVDAFMPSSSSPSSRLEHLDISRMKDLDYLPEECFKNLISLNTLNIFWCGRLMSIPDLSSLTSLRFLRIRLCQTLNVLPKGVEQLPSLETLEISGCFHEVDISQLHGVNNISFKSLHTLRIFWARASMPNWLGYLSMLRHLHIRLSNELDTIPEWMQNLKSLQTLVIEECPKLTKKWKKEIGDEDWKKIAHIPYIEIEGDVIQQKRL